MRALFVIIALSAFIGVAALSAASCKSDSSTDPGDSGVDADDEPPPDPPKKDSGPGTGPIVIEVDCPVGVTPEVEPNDTPDTATVVDSLSFCGALSPATDIDYSKFSTPTGKKLTLFQAAIDGAVDFDLIVNGKTLQPSQVSQFEAGDYLIKAYTKGSVPAKYKYRIEFEP
jgi:hypothetical protein